MLCDDCAVTGSGMSPIGCKVSLSSDQIVHHGRSCRSPACRAYLQSRRGSAQRLSLVDALQGGAPSSHSERFPQCCGDQGPTPLSDSVQASYVTWLGRSGQAAWLRLPVRCQLHWQAAQCMCSRRPHPPVSTLFRRQALWNSQKARRTQPREQALLSNSRAGNRQLRQQALQSSCRAGLHSQGTLPRGPLRSLPQRRCRHPRSRHLLPVQHALCRGTATAQLRLQPVMQRAAALRRSSRCCSCGQQPGLPSPPGPC